MVDASRRQTGGWPFGRYAPLALLCLGLLAACSSGADGNDSTRTGIEILVRDSAHILSGMRVGLITNHTGRALDGTPSALLLRGAGIDVVSLFSPEHGFRGTAAPGQVVEDTVDAETGLPVSSLYGQEREFDPEALAGLDALVFDIQDIGARYYTYVSTMAQAMRAAAQAGILFVVADRPNPIGGEHVQGNVLDPAFASFVGPYPVAMRHGMTPGELALMFNREFGIGAELRVAPASGWTRSVWADSTGIPWVATSPNMPDLESAVHYPGTCLFEGTDLSVGRGTDRPFQQVGAPWLDTGELLRRAAAYDLPGVGLTPVRFRPEGPQDGKFDGEVVAGVRLEVTDRRLYDPTRTAVIILAEVRRMGGAAWEWREDSFDRLAGTDRLRLAIESGVDPEIIVDAWRDDLDRFEGVRAKYLLYP
jgi:uncharacterized protein YbbC (DUF1343 family)